MLSQLAIKLNEFYFPSKVWQTIRFPKYVKLFATTYRHKKLKFIFFAKKYGKWLGLGFLFFIFNKWHEIILN